MWVCGVFVLFVLLNRGKIEVFGGFWRGEGLVVVVWVGLYVFVEICIKHRKWVSKYCFFGRPTKSGIY